MKRALILCFYVQFLSSLLVGATAEEKPIFSVSVKTDKQAYIVGEPVSLSIVFIYNGKEALTVTHPLDNGEYSEEIAIASSKEYHRFLTPDEVADARRDRQKLPPLKFRPGDKVIRLHTLWCWPKGFSPPGQSLIIFFKAGEYKIRFMIRFHKKEFEDEATILVRDAFLDADKGVWALLGKEEIIYFLQYPSSANLPSVPQQKNEILNRCRKALEEFPSSIFAPYIKKALEGISSPNKNGTNNPAAAEASALASEAKAFIEASQKRRKQQGMDDLKPQEMEHLLQLGGFVSKESVERQACLGKMRQIAMALKMAAWDDAKGKMYPRSLGLLLAIGYIKDPQVFIDPSNPNPPTIKQPAEVDEKSDFTYIAAGIADNNDPEKIILYCRGHGGEGRHVIFADGHSVLLKEEEFQKLLDQHHRSQPPK